VCIRIFLYLNPKIWKMHKAFSIIPMILGLALAAMTYPLGLIGQQQVYATLYYKSSSEDVISIAYPSSIPSNSKMTNQDNLTASKAHKDNPTQIQSNSQPPLPTK
jgi:hypothetical protein